MLSKTTGTGTTIEWEAVVFLELTEAHDASKYTRKGSYNYVLTVSCLFAETL